jgi:hypothetical protein
MNIISMPVREVRRRRTLIASAFLLWLFVLPAAAQVSVHAFVDRMVASPDEVVSFKVEVTGDFRTIDRAEPPDASGLDLVSRIPHEEHFVAPRYGHRHTVLTWEFRPTTTGSTRIGAARIAVGGRSFETHPIDVTLVAARRQPEAARRPEHEGLSVRAAPSARSAFVGEQIVVEYRLHHDADITVRGSRVAGAWVADGFWREELPVLQTPPVATSAPGVLALALKRLAAIPMRPGALTIEPVEMEIDLLRRQRSDSPFSMLAPLGRRYDRARVEAPAVTIQARALPSGAPPSFSGAVGSYQLSARLEPRSFAAGEAASLVLTITGRGNVAALAAPGLSPVAGIEVFPAQESVALNSDEDGVAGTKTFRYSLVAARAGRFELPDVEWTYFDPAQAAFRTLRASPGLLIVDGELQVASALHLMAATGWRPVAPPRPLHRSPWAYAVLALTLGMLPLLLVVLRDGTAVTRLRRWRRRRALDARLRRLAASDDAAREIEGVLRDYLAQRFDLPPGLSRAEVAAGADRFGIDIRTDLDDLLRFLEAARYAPDNPPASSGVLAARAGALIAGIERDHPDGGRP